METQQTQKVLTAAQRLERLEMIVDNMDRTIGNLAKSWEAVRVATTLLGRKVDAVVTLSDKNLPINDVSVSQFMENKSVQELKDQVDQFKEKGNFIVSETIETDSFLVARETNTETGIVSNPRLQCPLIDLAESIQGPLLGKKVGDRVCYEEAPLFEVEILEIYKIVPVSKNETNVVQ